MVRELGAMMTAILMSGRTGDADKGQNEARCWRSSSISSACSAAC
jgi:hypothetical protein